MLFPARVYVMQAYRKSVEGVTRREKMKKKGGTERFLEAKRENI